jgi:hypothetical protein
MVPFSGRPMNRCEAQLPFVVTFLCAMAAKPLLEHLACLVFQYRQDDPQADSGKHNSKGHVPSQIVCMSTPSSMLQVQREGLWGGPKPCVNPWWCLPRVHPVASSPNKRLRDPGKQATFQRVGGGSGQGGGRGSAKLLGTHELQLCSVRWCG